MEFAESINQAFAEKFMERNGECIKYIKNRLMEDIKKGETEFRYYHNEKFKSEQQHEMVYYFSLIGCKVEHLGNKGNRCEYDGLQFHILLTSKYLI